MRDNFPEKVKQELAKRVAFKCSFPNCPVITVGPSKQDKNKPVNVGEAAHIFAASEKGPRPNPDMTSEERKSIDNGIWMCRQHAKLIDSDYKEYSATTLKQWKQNAEYKAYKQLQEPFSGTTTQIHTLISLGSNVIFKGIWKSVKGNKWKFLVIDFIIGNVNLLKEFSADKARSALNNYIVVESQGDGRKLDSYFSWEYVGEDLIIEVEVKEKSERENPHQLGGDIAIGEDGDISFEDGDFALVSGIDNAKQILRNMLNIGFGELKYAPTIGNHFSYYFWKFKESKTILDSLLMIEITRLISIPPDNQSNSTPTLNFINRVIECEILKLDLQDNNMLPIRIKLEWGNGEMWESKINIFIRQH